MPKNKVTDLITDQEIAFARLILAGTMTDRDAAQAVGLNPDTAAYTKSKPRVRAYMIEHRAAVQQQLVNQETEAARQRSLGREKVLARLWEIASLNPEMTRGNITGQVRALTMIVAMEGLSLSVASEHPRNSEYPRRNEHRKSPPPAIFASRKGKSSPPSPARRLPSKKRTLVSQSPNRIPHQ
jgi:hypothetical protein